MCLTRRYLPSQPAYSEVNVKVNLLRSGDSKKKNPQFWCVLPYARRIFQVYYCRVWSPVILFTLSFLILLKRGVGNVDCGLGSLVMISILLNNGK
ncbi:hypothetical protein L873DRAFT_1518514 [Choiromyces venosus 120613-1]|uniref:Uncharacterized protein n=1 Tax=Choiromyces venosus 120613-1 TaxID=1336337 RepID=A0A3N4J9F6_9PEZI|nr:hypothetical protein L873DRAFT_1518514 [Choiromyces venosus 120613-1]